MKKQVLFIAFLLFLSVMLFAQQDTIVAWTFPTGVVSTDIYADAGLADNVGVRYIAAEDSSGNELTITMTNGATDYAATATGWQDGADNKFWSVKFKASGYKDLVVYSKQRSGGNYPGPADWKLQWRMSGGTWADITGNPVTVADDWTTGVVDGYELPDTCDDPGSTSIYIRWIMTTNNSSAGGTVDSAGIAKIDDIIIFGSTVVDTGTTGEGDTIAGWTFPTGVDTVDSYANLGLASNLTKYISAEDTTEWPNTVLRTLTFTNGASDFAATATGWDNGDGAKLWSIKFKAEGYSDLKVSSKQRSGGTNPGPRDFKIQARLSGGTWIDIPGGNITVGNDWTSGVATNLELPDDFDNPGTTNIFIRWIMTSNLDINGGTVDSTGISKIDDVIVTGISGSGIRETVYAGSLNIFPNPCSETLNIRSTNNIDFIGIFDISGSKVISENGNSLDFQMDVSALKQGMYFVSVKYCENPVPEVRKVIVR
ncbi:MAG: T9SS type A sorting domain-containing protein [Bacteroidetes bacterium]|nr:T9SS type A sorting domain-containing protein [Bacteroidota bacterium]